MKTSASRVTTIYVAMLCVFCAIAGGVLCWLNPARAWVGLLAMFFLPTGWALLAAVGGSRRSREGLSGFPAEWLRALALAGTMQAASLLAVLLSRLGMAPDLATGMRERSGGFLLGLLVVVLSNTASKKAVASARRQQVMRRSAWALVLGGLGYSLAWLLLPLSIAGDVALWLLMSAVIYVAVQVLSARASCASSGPAARA